MANFFPARLDGINLVGVVVGAFVFSALVSVTLTTGLLQKVAESLDEG